MKYHNKIVTISIFMTIIILTIGYIYRPVTNDIEESLITDKHLSYQINGTINNTIHIKLQGSGYQNLHNQLWVIYDQNYDISRTGHIKMIYTGGNIYMQVTKREKDKKAGGSAYRAIDKVYDTIQDTPIHFLPQGSIGGYQYSTDRPWTRIQRSHDNLSINGHLYCHKQRIDRHQYNCSFKMRLSYPGGYRPIDGEIKTTKKGNEINDSFFDIAQALSVQEVLHRIK